MPTLNTKGRRKPWCPEKPPKFYRVNKDTKFYASTRWRKLSKIIRQQRPLCEVCLATGMPNPRPSTEVDHIIPINKGGDPWSESNLQALCSLHHAQKSARDR